MSLQNAFLGSLVADALAMPGHWYYDTRALDRDYGDFDGYDTPRNPHPDSILWRSRYEPLNEGGDILHDQAPYWGQRGVHYHQFLEAGENTLNLQLAVELYRLVIRNGGYDADAWLERYIDVMRTPGWHRDTYVEEYHREFFTNLASGRKPRACGVDDFHIGGLSQVPALLAALDALGETDRERLRAQVATHVALTHRNTETLRAADGLTRLLVTIDDGLGVHKAIAEAGGDWCSPKRFERWSEKPDRSVVGGVLSTACYLPESFTASLYFAWKYAGDFSGGIRANAHAGGDNCHRGVVVGSLLGAECVELPEPWLQPLKAMEALRCDQPVIVSSE